MICFGDSEPGARLLTGDYFTQNFKYLSLKLQKCVEPAMENSEKAKPQKKDPQTRAGKTSHLCKTEEEINNFYA
jgi:hypothetical protein